MLTLTTDLFLTDCFLVKGTVENKYTRLSRLLDGHRKSFLRVRDVTLIDLVSRERIQTPLLHMNLDEILMAHEFLDEAGDEAAANLARGIKAATTMVTAATVTKANIMNKSILSHE